MIILYKNFLGICISFSIFFLLLVYFSTKKRIEAEIFFDKLIKVCKEDVSEINILSKDIRSDKVYFITIKDKDAIKKITNLIIFNSYKPKEQIRRFYRYNYITLKSKKTTFFSFKMHDKTSDSRFTEDIVEILFFKNPYFDLKNIFYKYSKNSSDIISFLYGKYGAADSMEEYRNIKMAKILNDIIFRQNKIINRNIIYEEKEY